MNKHTETDDIMADLLQVEKDIKEAFQRYKSWPRFGSGRLTNANGSIHFTSAPIANDEVDQ